MWIQFQAALATARKGQKWLDTLITLSKRNDSWSQELGLALFLLIDRFQARMALGILLDRRAALARSGPQGGARKLK